MKGLELSRAFYEEYGQKMLEDNFPELLKYIAVGFTGKGSERYGFDDDVSKDHDFEPGFCIFLPGEDVVSRRDEFLLERAYSKLPKEFDGVKRQILSPVGGNRNGVIRTGEYYLSAVGSSVGRLSADAWLRIPDYALSEAVNGEIFYDGYGEVTEIRERLRNMPEDIRLKRLAGNLLIMAQSGQYNYMRCIRHGEMEASVLACTEFVTAAMKTVFLLNNSYMPFYKWSFHALKMIEGTEKISENLSLILLKDSLSSETAQFKYGKIEETAEIIIGILNERGITGAVCGDLEKHAYSVNDSIKDGRIRNMHILTAV